MKSWIPIALCSSLAASLLTVTVERLAQEASVPPATPALAPRVEAPAAPSSAPTEIEFQLSELGALREQLHQMELRLAQVEASAAREPARASLGESDAHDGGTTASAALLASDAPEARALVEQVLEEQRVAREQERAAERLALGEELASWRAQKIAEELGLSPGDSDTLSAILVEESQRRREVVAELEREGFSSLEQLSAKRESLDAVRAWKEQELEARLGVDVARQIAEVDRGPNPFGRGKEGPFGGKAAELFPGKGAKFFGGGRKAEALGGAK